MLELLASAILSAQAGESSLNIRERICASVYESADGTFGYEPEPDMRVIDIITHRDTFDYPLPDNTVAIVCARSTLVPHPGDYKILLAGYIFTAAHYEQGRAQLELVDGRIVQTITDGEMTEQERAFAAGIIEQMQREIDAN